MRWIGDIRAPQLYGASSLDRPRQPGRKGGEYLCGREVVCTSRVCAGSRIQVNGSAVNSGPALCGLPGSFTEFKMAPMGRGFASVVSLVG